MNNIITKDHVEKIARLAKLKLNDQQLNDYSHSLTSVLRIIDEVRQVDTTNIVPTAQVTGLSNVFREDKIDANRCLSQKDATSNAPDTYRGFIKIKAIF